MFSNHQILKAGASESESLPELQVEQELEVRQHYYLQHSD